MNDSYPHSNCPLDEVLAALVAGNLEDVVCGRIVDHLDQCEDCQTRVEAMMGVVEAEMGLRDGVTASTSCLHDIVRQAMLSPTPAADERDAAFPFLAACDEPNSIGALGPFVVEELIARGGMSIVFRARDPAAKRKVAIKVLAPELAVIEEARERFVREARASATINHENVLPVLFVSNDHIPPYLAMPFNDGETLEQKVRREGPLTFEEIRRIATALANGLAASHARGIVHRDVKPANVLLSADGAKVRIADFGLARAADSPRLTMTGAITGTPQFMAPEQITGKEIDHRADLFSLGVTLHFLAKARSPFEAPTVPATMRNLLKKQPDSLRQNRSDIPTWFSDLVDRLLQKEPAQRVQSAAEASATLSQDHASGIKMAQLKRMRPIIVVGAILVLLVGLMSGWFSNHEPSPIPHGMYLESSGETFITLEAAIDAAAFGDTIVITRSGPVECSGLIIAKPVRIRAKAGTQPVLASTDSTIGTVFDARAPLIIEGLIVRHELTPDLENWETCDSLIKARDDFSIANCRIERIWKINSPLTNGPAVVVFTGKRLDILNSEFYTTSSGAVTCNGRDDILARLENNAIAAAWCFAGGNLASGRVELSRNSFLGWRAVVCPRVASLDCQVSGNVFDVVHVLSASARPENPLQMLPNIKWNGSDNLYSANSFLTAVAGSEQLGPYAVSLDEWRERQPTASEESSTRSVARVLAPTMLKDFMFGERQSVEGLFNLDSFEIVPNLRAENANRGIDARHVGPGEAYARWREAPAFIQWSKQADAMIAAPAAGSTAKAAN